MHWQDKCVISYLQEHPTPDLMPIFIISRDGSGAAGTGCGVRPAQFTAWLNEQLLTYTIPNRFMGGELLMVRLAGHPQTFLSIGQAYTASMLGVTEQTISNILSGRVLNSMPRRKFTVNKFPATPATWPYLTTQQINTLLKKSNYDL
jgi:hypothetical protein